jgi:hypothetical protein
MSNTDLIHISDGLSSELKKILVNAGIPTFTDLSKLTRIELRTKAPKLKVRHLANLEYELLSRNKNFVPDDSIVLDNFINQRKLYELWKKGVDTYPKLEQLSREEFVQAMGGPKSGFFRKKVAAKLWKEKHDLTEKKRFDFPQLTEQTAKLLYKGGLTNLKGAASKSDFELAQILQPSFGKTRTTVSPLTRARLIEIKYAFLKSGIKRHFRPL